MNKRAMANLKNIKAIPQPSCHPIAVARNSRGRFAGVYILTGE